MKNSHAHPRLFQRLVSAVCLSTVLYGVRNKSVTRNKNTQVFLSIFSWSPSSGQNYKLQVFFTFNRHPKPMKLHTQIFSLIVERVCHSTYKAVKLQNIFLFSFLNYVLPIPQKFLKFLPGFLMTVLFACCFLFTFFLFYFIFFLFLWLCRGHELLRNLLCNQLRDRSRFPVCTYI